MGDQTAVDIDESGFMAAGKWVSNSEPRITPIYNALTKIAWLW